MTSLRVRGCRRPGEVWRGGASPSEERTKVLGAGESGVEGRSPSGAQRRAKANEEPTKAIWEGVTDLLPAAVYSPVDEWNTCSYLARPARRNVVQRGGALAGTI